MIFNNINVNARQISEIEHCEIPKKIELVFEIGLPVNETQFSKTTITKNNIFLRKLMLILVNINGNRQRQNRCIL